MKRFFWIAILVATIAISGCTPSQTAVPAATPLATVVPQKTSTTVIASTIIVPTRTSNLSFMIAAPVKEVFVKEGDVVQAGQDLVTVDSPDLEFSLAQAEAALRAAEFEHQYWIPARFNRPPERRQLAEAELVIAQKQFEVAQANLTLATLVAPFDGTVISLNIQQGEYVQPTETILTLADLNTLQIETTDLSERDIAQVKLGQTASVTIEVLNKEFEGSVTSISPMATSVGGDVVYKVVITPKEQPAGLLWGMNAEVEINTEP